MHYLKTINYIPFGKLSLSIWKYTVRQYDITFFYSPISILNQAASCGVEFSNYGVAKKLIRFWKKIYQKDMQSFSIFNK